MSFTGASSADDGDDEYLVALTGLLLVEATSRQYQVDLILADDCDESEKTTLIQLIELLKSTFIDTDRYDLSLFTSDVNREGVGLNFPLKITIRSHEHALIKQIKGIKGRNSFVSSHYTEHIHRNNTK